MTQRDRDRLVTLKKAQDRKITQKEAAEELQLTERHVRRLLKSMRTEGDRAVVHGLRGKPSNRRRSETEARRVIEILSQPVYEGFGPTLASEYLANKHDLRIGREALRKLMTEAGLWRAKRRKVVETHPWRPRRSRRGELVQWDTSTHDWLEGRGDRIYLIHMIDDATSELWGKFVRHDSSAENRRFLKDYLERNGKPVSYYTDRGSVFANTPPKSSQEDPASRPPTQVERALRELGIVWIPAHSPQAKGRVERSFGTAQDRLVKGMRVARVKDLAGANDYLEKEYLPWWNSTLRKKPARDDDAHRPLGKQDNLVATLGHVETRLVGNDYTISYKGQRYRLTPKSIPTGLRRARVRVEQRLEGELAVRFRELYLPIQPCSVAEKQGQPDRPKKAPQRRSTKTGSQWMTGYDLHKSMPLWKAAKSSGVRPDK